MTKIMLVEDDKSLREIYGVRLLAEGYDIVSAGDGEEALAMAIKERPQLIVSDVMMPKISGFDMLDILRSTTETRNIKVIMMTALSSEEQRQRGEQLGADRYLVKSQVGIEDVVRVVHEVLGDVQPVAAPAPEAQPAPQPQPVAPQPVSAPAPTPMPAPMNRTTAVPTRPSNADTGRPQLANPHPAESTSANPVAPSVRSRIIQPLNDPTVSTVDLNELLDKELAKEAGVDMNARPEVVSADAEKELMSSQLDQFSQQLPASEPVALDNIPTVSITSQGNFTSTSNDNAAPAPQVSTQTPSAPATQLDNASTMPTPISFTNTAPMNVAPAPQPAQPQQSSQPLTFAQNPPAAAQPLPPPPPVPPMPQPLQQQPAVPQAPMSPSDQSQNQ